MQKGWIKKFRKIEKLRKRNAEKKKQKSRK